MYSSYIKGKKHTSNYIKYISTRDGVEFNSKELIGAVSDKQKKLIMDVIKEFNFLEELEEYKKFLENKTMINASNFLTEAFNLIEDQSVRKEIYLKYISERPRVEKINTHGLFNSNGEADLQTEIKNIKDHKGPVWTHIISLKREDARRLGYDNLKQWQLLLKTKMPKVAESMNIELKNLVWNAAFHNEGYHPHIHLVMYSKDVRQGFLNQESISKIKSSLMNEIFKEELLELKKGKTLKRDEIKTEFGKELDKIYDSIVTKNYSIDVKLLNQFIELSKLLPNDGKLVYGYQQKDIKEKVDKLVVEILKNKDISVLYKKYLEYKNDVSNYYSGKEHKDESIVKDKEFRPLQNMVLKVVKNLDGYSIKLDDDYKQTTVNKDKLQEIESKMSEIEDNYKSVTPKSAFSDYKAIKEDNIEAEQKEFTEKSQEVLTALVEEITSKMKELLQDNDFKEEISKIYDIREKGLNTFAKKSLEKICNNIIKQDVKMKKNFLEYASLCDEYSSVLNKETNLILDEGMDKVYDKIFEFYHSEVFVVSPEVQLPKIKVLSDELQRVEEAQQKPKFILDIPDARTVKNNNFQEEENEIRAKMESSLASIENKFLSVLNRNMATNKNFRNELSGIFDVKNESLMFIENENSYVHIHVINALNQLFEDSALKGDYEKYLDASKDYSYLFKMSLYDLVTPTLNKFANEIISNVNAAFISTGPFNDNSLEKDIHDIILKGASGLNGKYMLNPKLDVNYKDYTKNDQEVIKYEMRNVISNLADLFYFNGKEEEMKKNRRIMLNSEINKKQRQAQYNHYGINY